jgi:hypothetical protein
MSKAGDLHCWKIEIRVTTLSSQQGSRLVITQIFARNENSVSLAA